MGSFEDPRRTTLYVASPGRYEVVWYLERGRDRKYLSNGGGRKVDVRDLDGGQDVALEFPDEALAAVK